MKKWIWVSIIGILLASPLYFRYGNKIFPENMDDNSIDDIEIEREENELMRAVNSGQEDIVKAKEVLGMLEELDFEEFEMENGEGTVLKLLKWLSKHSFEDEEDIMELLESMDFFIGEEYLAYMENVANAYINDKIKFIKVLSNIPEKIGYVANGMYNIRVYDRSHSNLFNDLNMIKESDELTEKEREVGVKLINTYASCIT